MSYLQSNVKQEAPARRSIDTPIIPQVSTSKSEVSPRNYTPQELRDLRAWLPWIKQPKPNSDRFRKAPVGVTGYPLATWRNSPEWRSYTDVIAQSADGVGIVAHGLIIVIDLDDCVIDPTKHTLTRFALHVYHRCKSYAEVSPSGKGIKIFARVTADVLAVLKSFKGELQGESVSIELLHSGMFATVTGRKLYAQTPDTLNDVSIGIQQIMSLLPAPRPVIAPAPAVQPGRDLDRTVITNYNQQYTAADILSRNGAKRYQGNLWHCVSSICPVHTGRDGSLYLRRSDKYGVVVKALNPACVLHKCNRDGNSDYIAAFDVMRFYECGGNMGDALKQARQELNQPIKKAPAIILKEVNPIGPAVVEPVENVTSVLQEVTLKIAGDIALTPAARNLINMLMMSVDSNACVKVDVPTLAAACNVSERTIQRATNQLMAAGYIRKYQDANEVGGFGSNIYQVVTCHVTSYLKYPSSDQPISTVEVDMGQARGGNSMSPPDETPIIVETAPAAQATKEKTVKTTTDHGDEQPIPRSPLSCPISVDYAGLLDFVHMLVLDKKYRLVYATDGQAALWSVKRCIAIVQPVFGDAFSAETITAAYTAAQDSKNVIKQYIKEIKRMNNETLAIEIESKRTVLASNRYKKTRALESAKLRCAMGEQKYRAKINSRVLPASQSAISA